MAEEETTSAPAPRGRTGAQRAGQTPAPLEAGRGTTTLDDAVVTKVASVAAQEVRGVHELGGGMARVLGSVTEAVGATDERTRGVSVEVGEREAAIDLTIVIDYGESIPRVAQAVRDNVIKRVEGICGLSVIEVNISVNDLYFPGDERQRARVE
jgi:uncharacterized alkaline shock family protein YloU